MAKMISSSEVSKRMGVFTYDEVKERARYYHTEDKMDEIQLWYDGYLFGKIKIYNPWLVIYFFVNILD